MSSFVGQEDGLSVKNLANLTLADTVSSRFVCIPLVDLKIEDPYTHSPSTWVRCTVT
jgi:hypothetical protein